VQTYIHLRGQNFPCLLTDQIPEEGVLIAHGDFLPPGLRPSAKRFIVEIKPDRRLSCARSNFVIVQSRHDPLHAGPIRFFVSSAFVPYWPQPNLIPRDPIRGDRFENICYMGNTRQFLGGLDDLEKSIKELGLKWMVMPSTRWNDYSDVDAVVAVRPRRAFWGAIDLDPSRKPASKLFNAWLAGVPAILSPDPSYQEYRISDSDYLVARTARETVDRLKKLADDPSLRRLMRENARRRAREIAPGNIAGLWIKIIEENILPAYREWSTSPTRRRWFSFARALAYT
jgi:hypothetical protein